LRKGRLQSGFEDRRSTPRFPQAGRGERTSPDCPVKLAHVYTNRDTWSTRQPLTAAGFGDADAASDLLFDGRTEFDRNSLLRLQNSQLIPCSAEKNSLLDRTIAQGILPQRARINRLFGRDFDDFAPEFPANSLQAGNFALLLNRLTATSRASARR